jgi:hypothetical protein
MALRIGDLSAATSFVGTDLFELSLAGSAGSRKVTGANLRTQLLAGGTGFTSTDPINAGIGTFVGGTRTTSAPVLNVTQTWNDGAVTFTGILANFTNTASAAASLLIDLQVGGISQFKVTRGGAPTFLGAITYGGVTLSNAVTGTGNMVLSASPTFSGTVIAAALTASGVITTKDGTEASPGIQLGTAGGTQGFFRAGNAQIGVSGSLLWATESFDIGSAGANRPRDGFFARNLTVSGTTAVQALTATTGGFTGTVTRTGATNSLMTGFVTQNTTDGTAASARIQVLSHDGSNYAGLFYYNASFTTSGVSVANGTLLYATGAGGMNLATANASGAIKLYTGAEVLAVTIASNQAVTFAAGITATTGTFSGHGTTASAANAFLDSGTGLLSRSTSSLRYKAVVGDYSADEAWKLIEGTKAIAYTPKEGGKEHVGLAAEWIHELDQRFTTVDKDGNPDWVQYPHLTAPLMLALADVKRRMQAAGLWN